MLAADGLYDIDAVFNAAKAVTGIPAGAVLSSLRTRRIMHARRAIYLTLREMGLSFQEIGSLLGRDHSTVIAGCRHADDTDRANMAAMLSLLSADGDAPAGVRAALADIEAAAGRIVAATPDLRVQDMAKRIVTIARGVVA